MRWTLPALVVTVLLAGGWAVWAASETPQDRYLDDVRDTPGYSSTASDKDLFSLGYAACSDIGRPTMTRERVIEGVTASAVPMRTAGVSEVDARVITDAAYAHLCPEKTFAQPPPVVLTDQQRFLAAIDSTPGLSRTYADDDLTELGRMLCDMIGTPGITRVNLLGTIGVTKLGPEVAPVLLGAAELHLCPGKVYSTAPGIPVPTSSAPQAVASGPPTSIGEGTYEVGVDVAPGKYKTTGASDCYWARLKKNDGSLGDIADNNFGAGPQVTTLRKGEYFETTGCPTWMKSG